jgi:thiosulfate/3-mercaptopyruvate sulfurtransferase
MERALMGATTPSGTDEPPVPVDDARPALMSTDSLAALLGTGDVTVVDVRTDVSYYLRSHIPGAVYSNSESLRSMADGEPDLLLPAASYVTLFTRLGIRPGRPIVIYSAGETRDVDATYLAWILSGFGVPGVSVLDGGFAKWELESRATARTYAAPVPGSFPTRTFTPDLATLDDVQQFLGRAGGPRPRDLVLVDARTPDQYAGEAGVQMRRGHIPGAIDHDWSTDLTDGLSHAFKSLESLRASYAAQGILPADDIIVYCNRGVEATHLYFVLHDLLGYPRVRVYDGSWTEYAAHSELPVARGPAP